MRNEKGHFIKGHGFTDEMLQKMSKAKIGKSTWNKGIPCSKETKIKVSEALKGRVAWNKGLHTNTNTNKNLRTGKDMTCPICGNIFYVQAYALQSGRKKFCSKKCFFIGRESKNTFQSGENHPAWIDGNCRNGYTPEFSPSLKKRIKERDDYTCQLCGITEEKHKEKFNRALCVNHIDFDKSNCAEHNLNTLCNGCNIKINWDREYYKNYFKTKTA